MEFLDAGVGMELTRAYTWTSPAVGETTVRREDFSLTSVRVGFVGLGDMGSCTLDQVLDLPGVSVVAICDVDKKRMNENAAVVAKRQPEAPCTPYCDFRELNRAADVDAVVISTPDHWHALVGMDAMQCGKDVYIEKPLTHTVAEGRRLCDVAGETGRICQTGSQQRSSREFRHACELIRNGYLGDIASVEFTIPPCNRKCGAIDQADPIPDSFDYDMWLGPAPWQPYYTTRCHYNFRFVSDYAGGQMTNWGAHMLDIVQWALDADASGPVRVEGRAKFSTDGIFDIADNIDITWTYPGNIPVRCTTAETPSCRFIGTRGELNVGRGLLETTPEALATTVLDENDLHLERSDNHFLNFIDSIRDRTQPICNAETGHRSATACHIGNIALRLGVPLKWDSAHERFVDNDEANEMLSRPKREPWNQLTQKADLLHIPIR